LKCRPKYDEETPPPTFAYTPFPSAVDDTNS
jgi:hypothetical protein